MNKNFDKKFKILNEKISNEKKVEKLIDIHKSTFERKEFYEEIYDKIFDYFEISKKSKIKIIDIACGLNPISYFFLKKQFCEIEFSFRCYEINLDDCIFLNEFFKVFKINGKAKNFDIIFDYKKIKSRKEDIIFLFKSLDSFEFRKKDFSKIFLESLNSKNLIISFPKKSLISKKNISSDKRNWIRNFFKKKNYKFSEFEIENELFFLVKK